MEVDLKLNEIERITPKSESLTNQYILFDQRDFKKLGISMLRKIKLKNTLIFDASNSDNTREIVERELADIIINAEYHSEKDYTFQPNSGMDYVICRMMGNKGIKYGFLFEKIKAELNNNSKILLSRIKQNLFLCRKYGVEIIIDDSNKLTNILKSI